MSMNHYDPHSASTSPVAQRKAAVRKHSRAIQITGAVGAALVVLGLLTSAGSGFIFFVIALAIVIAGYNGWKIRTIINHVDEW